MPDFPTLSIHDALDSIAAAFGFNADELIEYAALDPHGGYNDKYEDGCPMGSLWRVEGQILYALVRALKPDQCLELGTFRGCSASHIAQGLSDNVFGSLLCVSLEGCIDCLIPKSLQHRVEITPGNLFPFLQQQQTDMQPKYDFIFEDTDHSKETTEFVWRAAYSLLKPGGVIVSHDAAHFLVGQQEREAIGAAGYFGLDKPAKVYLIKPSDCGLAIWRKLPAEDTSFTIASEPVPRIIDLFPKAKEDNVPQNESFDSMSLQALKDYAAAHQIPLGKTRAKADVIAQILESEQG